MSFENINDIAYFFARGEEGSNYTLWKSDGTTAGTVEVLGQNNYMRGMVRENLNGLVYFSSYNDGEEHYDLWKSDGTVAGTQLVKSLKKDESFSEFKKTLGKLFFTIATKDERYELWTSDANGNVTMLKDGWENSLYLSVAIDGVLYFTDGREQLWKTDGSVEGTVLVEGIKSATKYSYPKNLTKMKDIYYFTAEDGVHGRALWKSDGSESGTVLVKDIAKGAKILKIKGLHVVKDTLYFHVQRIIEQKRVYELWKSDGSESGTVKIKELDDFVEPFYNIGINGTLLFLGKEKELWKSDGTQEGTKLLKEIEGSYFSKFYKIEDTLYFSAREERDGMSSLWKSDATEAGTTKVIDFPYGRAPSNITDVNGTLFFSMDLPDQNSTELWKIDKNATEAVMLKKYTKVHSSRGARNFKNVNGVLYFIPLIGAYGGSEGTELWKSDGTVAGTKLVADIGGLTWIDDFIYLDDKVYVTFNDASIGKEIWVIDEVGISLFKDFWKGKQSSNPSFRGVINNELLFEVTDETGRKLWKTDGTVEGIKLVKSGIR